jgi:hypothetical protein
MLKTAMSHPAPVPYSPGLPYSYAVFNGIPVPPTWVCKKTAGKDWFTSFLKRKRRLSIRKPEATSQARAAALNRFVMNKFYDQVIKINWLQ